MFKKNDYKAKLLAVIDENNLYSQEDFDKEFGKIIVDEDRFKIHFNLINKSSNPDPEYATDGSSGFDLRADLNEVISLEPLQRVIVPTGLFYEIPDNFEIQIRPRSGLAAKHGVTVLNTPGTIDADYRGEIQVILINLGKETFKIENGERIAQGVIASVLGKKIIKFNNVSEFATETTRGVGGFGSTGNK